MATAKDSPAGHARVFLLVLARALHEVGQPAHRLDALLVRTAQRLGVTMQLFGLPTGLILSFDHDGGPVTHVLPIQPGAVHLERLIQLTQVADEVIHGRLSAQEARTRLEAIMTAPPRWGRPAIVAAYLFSAMAFAIFFGAGWAELIVATMVGLAVGGVAVAMERVQTSRRLFELLAAAAAALVAEVDEILVGSFVEWVPVAAGLIILLPGIMLVDAVEELSYGHLVSGGARMAGVAVVFLALTFGTILGTRLADFIPGEPPAPKEPQTFPPWSLVPALLLVAVGSTIRFRARPRDVAAILAASALALLAARMGTDRLGHLAGPFLAALLLGLLANLFARWRRLPAELLLIPGLATLVPGSVGVKSIAALLSMNPLDGINAAFEMFLIAMALVSGLLFSSSVLRERLPG